MTGLMHMLRRRLVVRRVLVASAHALIYALAFLLAFLLRFDFSLPESQRLNFLAGLGALVGLRLAAGFLFRLYGGVLKYAGMKDLLDIVKAMSVATVAFVVLSVLLGLRGFPRSIIAIDWFLSILLVGGLRFGLRLSREALAGPPLDGPGGARKRVLIVGAGDAGEALARDLLRTHRERYDLVGFLDDNKAKQGLRIHDLPVLGSIMYLGDMVPRHRVDEVIIAIPSASGQTMRRIFDTAKVAGVRVLTIPGVDQLLDGKVSVNQIREVKIEDLLGREPVHLEEGLVRSFLHGKCVMVTGAGGSIGAEMCRQILRFKPRKLLLLEQAEPYLFFIHRELVAHVDDCPCVPIIADVTDGRRMTRVFEEHGPEVIFHAAAHKHVPMMEWNPGEAVKNNVRGTRTVAELARRFHALAFVMISTDKAVNPTSVMGASKRVAEMFVQALNAKGETRFSAVRFGNVLGSIGSVVPIFQEQIAKGGPVTVTDEKMRRYFMTIPEACQLVMQAGAMGEGGEIFALDMGEPVKIVELARDLIRLSGLTPDEDIEIEITGLRPGEKLFEELGFDAERMDKTRHPKVYTGKLGPHALGDITARVDWLLGLADQAGPDELRAALKAVVPEYAYEGQALEFEARAEERAAEHPGGVGESAAGVPPSPHETVTDGARGSPPPQAGEGEVRPAENPGGVREVAAGSTPGLRPALDALWAEFARRARAAGLVEVGWTTMGLRPPDSRRERLRDELDGEPVGKLAVLKRSVGVNSLAFIELAFYYPADAGRSGHERARELTRELAAELLPGVLRLNEHLGSPP
jgi:FlaA1/EpsC-like NDP-sugar epimerase